MFLTSQDSSFLTLSRETRLIDSTSSSGSSLGTDLVNTDTTKTQWKRDTSFLDETTIRDYKLAIEHLDKCFNMANQSIPTSSSISSMLSNSTNSLFSSNSVMSIHDLLFETYEEDEKGFQQQIMDKQMFVLTEDMDEYWRQIPSLTACNDNFTIRRTQLEF